MPYRAKVKVLFLLDSKGIDFKAREDLNFDVLVTDPSQIKEKAMFFFRDKYGPDLSIRVCNLQSRDSALIYCYATKAQAPSPKTVTA